MRREIVLLVVLVLSLLTSVSAGINPVKATEGPPYVTFEVTSGPPLAGSPPYHVTVSPGQSAEFAATPLFGTPPYSYQWSTEVWSSNPMDMMFNSSLDVPGATSQRFEYSEAAPGSYEVCVEINDSVGNSLDASGPIVIVQASNSTLLTSSSPLPTASPSPLSANSTAQAPQTIASTIAKTEPFPTLIVGAVAAASVAILAMAGLFLFFKKR